MDGSQAKSTSSEAASQGQPAANGMPEAAVRLEKDLRLRDGQRIHIRAIRADDTERLRAFHRRLSPDTIIFRFFGVVPELSEEFALRLSHVDYTKRMALVATTGPGPDEQILAVVRYDRVAPQTAEVAFVVEDRLQGHGIATVLLLRLAAYARTHDITTLVALTMATNARMLDVLHHCGFPTSARFEDGDIEVRVDISHPPSRERLPPDYPLDPDIL
jgi:RimJ/RimL family protein N-acetyltransferase